MSLSEPTRRDFVRLMAGLPFVITFRSAEGEERPSKSLSSDADDPADVLAGLISGESGAEIGRVYLRRFPREGDAARLVRCIAGDLDRPVDALRALDRRELLSLLERRRSRDFEEGRTVSLEGWVLSITEARLCALTLLYPA